MSRLRENLIDIYNHIKNDDTLMRLLYYKDNPLDPSLPNFNQIDGYQSIRSNLLLRSPKTNDLTSSPICRVCMYFGNRKNNGNKKVANQDIIFDVYVNIDVYDSKDVRSLWICDRITAIMNDQRVTGVGDMLSENNYIIGNPPEGYIGYKLVFSFGSVT